MSEGPTCVGRVAALWRYPVKSMLGEELNATGVTERGLLGDRMYGLVDRADGKVATAKNPRTWLTLFDYRAAFVDAPSCDAPTPPVRITMPDGTTVTTTQWDRDQILSQALHREVTLTAADQREGENVVSVSEKYWLDMEDPDYRDTVTDFELPAGILRTMARHNQVHLGVYASVLRGGRIYRRDAISLA